MSNKKERLSYIHVSDEDTTSKNIFDSQYENSMEISHINPNLISQFNKSCMKEKFEDMPLQMSSSDKIKMKHVMPHLTVEDKGEKKD
jgi:hypothetical protein